MNLKQVRTSFSDFINRYKIVSIVINSAFDLFFFTIRKINKLFAHTGGNVAVISLHRLGDTVFTFPAIREIIKNFDKKITIVCHSESIPIYNLAFNDLNFFIINRENFFSGDRVVTSKVRKKFRSIKPEVIIDLTGGMYSASLIFNSRVKKIIGISKIHFRFIYDHFVEIRKRPQLVDIYLDAIAPVIQIPDRDRFKKHPLISNRGGKILIHPFAGWKEKEWNFNRFLNIALKLNNEFPVSLLIPADQISMDIHEEIENLSIEIIQTNTVDELVQTIKECSVFIGNDSGPVNIANFLGRPTFTIYGATNPAFTASNEGHQPYIQNVLNCSAKQNEKFCIIGGAEHKCPGVQCMNLLTIEDVSEKLIPLVEKYCYKKL